MNVNHFHLAKPGSLLETVFFIQPPCTRSAKVHRGRKKSVALNPQSSTLNIPQLFLNIHDTVRNESGTL